MCYLYPYNNVKLLRKFFYINNDIEPLVGVYTDCVISATNCDCRQTNNMADKSTTTSDKSRQQVGIHRVSWPAADPGRAEVT